MDGTVPKPGSGANPPRTPSSRPLSAAQQRELEDALLAAHGLTRAQVPDGFLRVALIRVTAGALALDAPELKELFRPFLHGVRRASSERVFRERGQTPPGADLEERRRRVFVRGLCRFLARLSGPRNGAPQVQATRSQPHHVPLHPGENERHPRASELALVQLTPDLHAQLARELERDLGQGLAERRRRPLPDDLARSPSTRRRMRRKQQARLALARQLGRPTSERSQDPEGMRPLPLHEGRLVARMLRDPREKLRFMRSLPPPLRHQLERAARYRPQSRPREAYADATLHITAWFAFLTYCSQRPRKSRVGFERAVEGFCREALAAAFPPNPNSGAPFDANSLSNWTRTLERFGLVLREQPNHQKDAYRGPTGWALSVYRLPSAVQLQALLAQLASSAPPLSSDGTRRPLGAYVGAPRPPD